MDERNKKISISFSTVFTIVVVLLVIIFQMPKPIVKIDDGRRWHIVWEGSLAEAGEATPPAGESGILWIGIINHTDPPEYLGNNNTATLETWCDNSNLGWCNADDSNVDIAHSTDFDIIVKVRGNMTNAGDGDDFNELWIRVNITSANLGISETTMAESVLQNVSTEDFIWTQNYVNNSGSGYSIARDETAEITSIKLECYY